MRKFKKYILNRTFLLLAESKSMPPKLWHGFTRWFQWKIILQFEKTNMFLPRVNLCHQKCGMDLLIMKKRKIIYYNLRKIIFSFSFCIKGKSMPPKLWSWNDRNFDQKRSKLFDMDRTFLLFAESKSMPPKLWHGFTRPFQWQIILKFEKIQKIHFE